MFKFTGITKQTFSREGVALDGEVTTVRIAGPAEVLVVSMGANRQEIDSIANQINASGDLLEALEEIYSWLVCACISTPEDMAQSFPHMEKVTRVAIVKARGEA